MISDSDLKYFNYFSLYSGLNFGSLILRGTVLQNPIAICFLLASSATTTVFQPNQSTQVPYMCPSVSYLLLFHISVLVYTFFSAWNTFLCHFSSKNFSLYFKNQKFHSVLSGKPLFPKTLYVFVSQHLSQDTM